MQLIHDENAFQQAITRGRQQKKQQEPLHFSIAIGGTLQPDMINQVKADIHKLLTDEINAFGQDPMPSLPSFASSPQSASAPTVHITLPNLGIPAENSRLLESYLEHRVREELAKAHPAISSTCILGNGIPGMQVDLLEILALVTSIPPSSEGWLIAWVAAEDIFAIEISATRLSSTDQAVIGLANTCSSCWAKEIEIFSICPPNNRGTIHQDGCNATPIFTTLFQAGGSGAHTIIFRKPKFLGIWTDMYHPDTTTFWEIFGGRTVTFTWVDDTGAKLGPFTSGAITVRRSNGSLFTPNEGWTNNPYVGNRGTFFADVTGDGKADAIVVNDATVTVRRSTGTSFSPNEDWTHGPYYGNRGTFFADVTGDGKADAIVVNDDTVTVRRSTGTSFSPNEDWTHGPFFGTILTAFADVDGDGRADAIAVSDDKIRVRRSTGNSFGPSEDWTQDPFFSNWSWTYFADVTGDGKADAITVSQDTVRVRRSTGNGFGPVEDWTHGPYFGTRRTVFADVDGDGRADAITVSQDTVRVRRSTGSGFGPVEDWTHGPYFGNWGTFFADVTGDGKADAIVSNAQ